MGKSPLKRNSKRNDKTVVIKDGLSKNKYGLSIEEAARYFAIGKTRLYEFIRENPDCLFLLRNRSKFIIKREQFEAFLNEQTDLWDLQ